METKQKSTNTHSECTSEKPVNKTIVQAYTFIGLTQCTDPTSIRITLFVSSYNKIVDRI